MSNKNFTIKSIIKNKTIEVINGFYFVIPFVIIAPFFLTMVQLIKKTPKPFLDLFIHSILMTAQAATAYFFLMIIVLTLEALLFSRPK